MVACVLGGTAPLAHGQILEKVSEVTESRRLMSDDLRDLSIDTYKGYDAALAAMCVTSASDASTEDAEYSLAVYGFTTERTPLSSATTATATADGAAVPVERVEASDREYDDGDRLELARLYFSQDAFVTLAYADVVRLSIGDAVFVARRPEREDMRLILARLGI